jgi:hypothetical protein
MNEQNSLNGGFVKLLHRWYTPCIYIAKSCCCPPIHASTQGDQICPCQIGKMTYQSAWAKLDHYYQLSDQNYGIYGAAILFHPSFRKHYLEKSWKDRQQWIQDQRSELTTLASTHR